LKENTNGVYYSTAFSTAINSNSVYCIWILDRS
jgi:hypothetical protein